MATTGNKGKFTERLRNIALGRKKKDINLCDNKNILVEDAKTTYNNFLKVAAAIPLLVYDNVIKDDSHNLHNTNGNNKIDVNNENYYDINKVSININDTSYSNEVGHLNANLSKNSSVRSINNSSIKNIDVSLIKKKQNEYFNNAINTNEIDNKETKNNVKNINSDNRETSANNKEVEELEKRIINLIKKDLIKTVNELEILQSELYLINEVNGDEKTLKECQKNLDEVKKILCKIDILKKKYDFLKDNYDFEYMLETNSYELVDNIIELKNKFSTNEIKATVNDYKLLDVYKFLYLRIDQLKEDTSKFEDYKETQLELLKERDIDFDKLKSDVYNVDRTNEEYNSFVKNQNEFLNDLDNKIAKIDSYEEVNYKLKGFNQFLFNSFKYVGLLMLSPLKGVIPSIATETLITKNVVGNLYNNMEWEENRRRVYSAIDYSGIINGAINDLDYTSRIVDGTLEDIVNLKIKYNEEFKKYQGDFLEYEEVIRKINDMENKILGNKIKIEIMRKKMLEKEKQNSKKLELVKELNNKNQN